MATIKSIIKKLVEGELYRNDSTTEVYPVTHFEAVYGKGSERLDLFLKRIGVVNISTHYTVDHMPVQMTLEQAINTVPPEDRICGFLGTVWTYGGWDTYRYIGENLSDWYNTNYWKSLTQDNDLETISNEEIDSLFTDLNL